VGPGFEGGIAAAQILAFVVVLRAWIAMPSTVLKGTNHHRYLAVVSASGAVANLLLSIPLVKLWGLVGIALGTAIPVTVISCGLIFPKACRVVGLSLWQGYREVVWPALWPAVVVLAMLAATRHAVPVRLLPVLVHLAAGGAAYAVLFFRFGLSRDERRWVSSAVTQVWRHRSEGFAAA
jgi:O-antigen/teichoic acid export membrane protein